MSGDCQCPIGNDNCNNIIKHYDDTVFDLSLITNCHFKNKQNCIGTLRSGGKGQNQMLAMKCSKNKKMVCLFDCCKYPELKFTRVLYIIKSLWMPKVTLWL